MITARATIVGALLAVHAVGVPAIDLRAAEVDLRERLQSEAPAAWAKVEEASRHTDVRYLERATFPAESMEFDWEVKRAGDWAAFIATETRSLAGKDPEVKGIVVSRNSKNAFELTRSGSSGSWFVKKISHDLKGYDDRLNRRMKVGVLPLFSLYVFLQYLPDWIREPTFVVKDVHWSDPAARTGVALTFEYSLPPGKRPVGAYWPRRGVLVLRPDKFWVIEEYRIEMVDAPSKSPRGFKWEHKNELTDATEYPVVSGAHETFDSITEGRVERSWTFTKFEQRDIPEAEFTLDAFGISVGSGLPLLARARLWMILVAAGVLSIVIAIWVRRRTESS